MKKIAILLMFVFLFVVLTGCNKETNYKNIEIQNNIGEGIPIEKKIILEKGEMKTRGLFDLGDGYTYYEIDLMSNDMDTDIETSLYYKIITNMEDYQKYKERIEIPEMTEEDFKDKFLVIVANENIRKDNEKDWEIYDISGEYVTTITMKQKENPNLDGWDKQNNVYWAIVDNSVLKERVDIIIEH